MKDAERPHPDRSVPHCRPRFVCLPVLIGCLLVACGSPDPIPPEDLRVDWLAEHAAKIAVSPSVTDFSDLKPLRVAIGSARVVMLGEQSHGDGTTFLAKARLIQFLHQELGFDVLAFESGLYDMKKVWELIERGEEAGDAMSMGIFSLWADSAQLEPLIQYVEESAGSAYPLQLAGVDCQSTGRASEKYLVEELTAFLVENGSRLVDEPEYTDFASDLQALIDTDWRRRRPDESGYAAFEAFLRRLRGEVEGLPTAHEVGFWKQMLKSLEQESRISWSMATGVPLPNRVNLRDIQMGDNLVWLLEHGFPGRRIIVWGATIHGARGLPEIEFRDVDVSYGEYRTMGQEVWNRIGPDYYAVGFTAATGEAGLLWMDAFPLDPPAKGSIEELFRDAGFENAFLDLRHIPAGGEWLHERLLSRPFGYSYSIACWPRHLDGLVFTRVMERSTPG